MVQPINIRDAFICRHINFGHGGRQRCGPRCGRGYGRVTLARGLGVAGNRLIGSSGICDVSDTLQKRVEPVMLQKCGEWLFGNRPQSHVFNRDGQWAIFFQSHQHFRQTRLIRMLNQIIAHFGGLHRRCSGQDTFEVTKFLNKLCRGLWPDAGDTRHIVYAIAHQRQHIANPFGLDTEFFVYFLGADAFVFHCIEHVDGWFHQLHQVLVAADDGHMPAGGARGARIACDHVIGLDIILFDQRQRERACRIADHRELWP